MGSRTMMEIDVTQTDVDVSITSANVNVYPYGANGWSPILAVRADVSRKVLQVSDWAGGTGNKPVSGLYVGPNGLVSDITQAVDIGGGGGGGAGIPIDTNDPQDGDVFIWSDSLSAWTNYSVLDGGNF